MNFGFFGPKMAVSWRTSAVQKERAWNPYFYSVFGFSLLGARCQKGNFEKRPRKNGKIWLIIEKLFFGIFAGFFGGFFFFVFFFGPPHLALNPPCFFGFGLFFLCFFVYFFFFLFLFFWFLVFGFFFTKKNLVFPLEKGIFCLFSVFLFLSPLAFFGLPLFLFLFLCLSLFFFSFLIPSCLCFLLSFGSLFWYLSLFFFLLCFSFMKGTTSKYSIASFFFINIFSFFGFQSFFCFKFLFLIFAISWFSVMFFVQHQGFWFQHKQLKKQNVWSTRGLQQNGVFFYQPVFYKMSKVIVFGHFGAIFGWCSKSTVKIGISAHF